MGGSEERGCWEERWVRRWGVLFADERVDRLEAGDDMVDVDGCQSGGGGECREGETGRSSEG